MAKVLNKINWVAYSNKERNAAINQVQHIIDTNDGYILNFNLFSDLALSLMIEIEESNIPNLYDELESILNFSSSKPKNINNKSKKSFWILMNLSFSKGNGNLTKEIPNVPG